MFDSDLRRCLARWIWLGLLAWAGAVGAAGSAAAQGEGAQELDGWLRELRTHADDADPELVQKVAAVGSRDAAFGLLEVYDGLKTVQMQREVVRGLARFAGVDEAAQPVLEKLANLAGSTTVPDEVRTAAIEGLGAEDGLGRRFLQQLVDGQLADSVREQALRQHIRRAGARDDPWYRALWNLSGERKKNDAGEVLPDEWPAVRELAFEGLSERLSESALVDAIRQERSSRIRRAALEVMHERKLPRTAEMAKWMMERVDLQGVDRAAGAQVLAEIHGPGVVPTFLELAAKRDVTPSGLRAEMARIIAAMEQPAVAKAVARLIGRGDAHERVFAIDAVGVRMRG